MRMSTWSMLSIHVMFQVVSLEAGEMGKLPEQTDGAKEPYPVPKELWFLCDIMTSLGLSKENLFLQVRERNCDKCHQYLKKALLSKNG